MFGNKLATAETKITALLGILAAIGYKPATAEEATEAGLQAHLASREKAACDAAVAPVQAIATAYADGLKAAGITPATKEGEALTAEAVKTAVETTIAARAQRQAVETVASAGHAAAIETPKGADPAPDAATMSAEQLGAAVQAEKDPVKRKSLFVTYERRFLDAKR